MSRGALIAGFAISFGLWVFGVLWIMSTEGMFAGPVITCNSFVIQPAAQRYYREHGPAGFDESVRNSLDRDGDGQVCESLPNGTTQVRLRDFEIVSQEKPWGEAALLVVLTLPVAYGGAFIVAATLEDLFGAKDQPSFEEQPKGRVPYRQYLQSAEWRRRRAAAIQRAGGRCQLCNRHHARLEVHHRTYERLGHERDDDLIVLCRDCHQMFHTQRGMPVSR